MIAILRNGSLSPVQRSAATDDAQNTLCVTFDILKATWPDPIFGADRWGLADFMIACVLYIVRIRLQGI